MTLIRHKSKHSLKVVMIVFLKLATGATHTHTHTHTLSLSQEGLSPNCSRKKKSGVNDRRTESAIAITTEGARVSAPLQ